MALQNTRQQNFTEWYNELIEKAYLCEHSGVRGCMILLPDGAALWDNMRLYLDKRIKITGHKNYNFPLLIPKSYLSKEANHVEGFAKECAIVTHYRLKSSDNEVVVDDDARLEEELIIRPTSETMIWKSFKKWIQSYRDLPILANQWANVMRWEMRTRPFLRTAEFYWQEGHTAHRTYEEAQIETLKMLEEYKNFMVDILAMPVITGDKSPSERFAGAEHTYTCEAMMQDGKALQMGTSHNLGQNFAKAFDVQFQDIDETLQIPYGTSWGVSTRMIGGLIMMHGDDNGLVLPPRIAPIKAIIIPLYNDDITPTDSYITGIIDDVKTATDDMYELDTDTEHRPGYRFSEAEMRGIPLRIVVGSKDKANNTVEIVRRDTLEKQSVSRLELIKTIQTLLIDIQNNLYNRALEELNKRIYTVDSWDDFIKYIELGGFVYAHWDGTEETEKRIKELTGATTRCYPFDMDTSEGVCILTNKPSIKRILFAKAY